MDNDSLIELEGTTEVLSITTEHFERHLVKDRKCTALRTAIDESLMIDEYRVLCYPQNEKKIKDGFVSDRDGLLIPIITHLVLLEADHGGMVLAQTFTPRCVGVYRFTPTSRKKCEMLMKNPNTNSGAELRKTNSGLKDVATRGN